MQRDNSRGVILAFFFILLSLNVSAGLFSNDIYIFKTYTNGTGNGTSSGQNQTPWLSNVDGAGYTLFNISAINDSSSFMSIDPNTRILYSSDGSTILLNWSDGINSDYMSQEFERLTFTGSWAANGVYAKGFYQGKTYFETGELIGGGGNMKVYYAGGSWRISSYLGDTTDCLNADIASDLIGSYTGVGGLSGIGVTVGVYDYNPAPSESQSLASVLGFGSETNGNDISFNVNGDIIKDDADTSIDPFNRILYESTGTFPQINFATWGILDFFESASDGLKQINFIGLSTTGTIQYDTSAGLFSFNKPIVNSYDITAPNLCYADGTNCTVTPEADTLDDVALRGNSTAYINVTTIKTENLSFALQNYIEGNISCRKSVIGNLTILMGVC